MDAPGKLRLRVVRALEESCRQLSMLAHFGETQGACLDDFRDGPLDQAVELAPRRCSELPDANRIAASGEAGLAQFARHLASDLRHDSKVLSRQQLRKWPAVHARDLLVERRGLRSLFALGSIQGAQGCSTQIGFGPRLRILDGMG